MTTIKAVLAGCEFCGNKITHHHRLCNDCHADRQKREARELRNKRKEKIGVI